MKSDEALRRLIKTYGIRRAVMLYGAASVAAARGWDVMIGDDAYSRQGVWTWKRDLSFLKKSRKACVRADPAKDANQSVTT